MTGRRPDGVTAGWFGPPERARPGEAVIAPPTDRDCAFCDEQIAPGDCGEVNRSGMVAHYECLIRAVVGSVAHQQRRCSCYGGTASDHDGTLTMRQAGLAAELYYRDHQPALFPPPELN